MTSNDFTTYCSCGCGRGLHVSMKFFDADGEVFVDTVTSGFESRQSGFFGRWRRRLQAAWFMIRGKEYILHEVVLDREGWKQFVGAVYRCNNSIRHHERRESEK